MTKLVLISDTHENHNKVTIPECDILIHSGDFTNLGDAQDVLDFLNWFKKQPAKHKIYIAGNHDLSYENSPEYRNMMVRMYSPDIIYLHDSGVEVEGLKIYGSPYQPEFCDWAFNLPRGFPLFKKWSLIPDDTNVLITHGPPHSILDLVDKFGRDAEYTYENVGCEDLYNRVKQLKDLKLHVFGHIHEQERQIEVIENVTFVNAALVNNGNRIIKNPIVVEL